jgi:hypothetical protein
MSEHITIPNPPTLLSGVGQSIIVNLASLPEIMPPLPIAETETFGYTIAVLLR